MLPRWFIVLLLLLPAAALGEGRSARFPSGLEAALSYFVPQDSIRRALPVRIGERIERAAREIAPLAVAGEREVAEVLEREILANLESKVRLGGEGPGRFPLGHEEILRTVVDFEIFKMRNYIASGVFPKRYFGFVDGKWDTGREEGAFLRLVHEVVVAINEHQEAEGARVRLSDLELVVTYLAEGGALFFLSEPGLLRDEGPARINLGRDLGCDNIGLALDRHGPLAAALDRRFGTRLARSARLAGEGATGDRSVGISRSVAFRESVVAAGLMFLYEKEVAGRKLAAVSRSGQSASWPTGDLMALPLTEQFIAASLVFNTGILFSREWTESIRDFDTIRRLHSLSTTNSEKRGRDWRPPLPVEASSAEAFRRLRERGYRQQPTSWQGSYHVLQRYGAFLALRDFTDLFDSGGSWSGASSGN